MSPKNCCSSYDFEAHQQRSQTGCCFSQTAQHRFEVLPDLLPGLPGMFSALPGLWSVLPGLWSALQSGGWGSQACRWRSQVLSVALKVLSGTLRCSQTYHNHFYGTPVQVISDHSYSESQLKYPPRVWYCPEIDTSKFALHILSDTSGGSQRLKYIFLM